MTTRHAILLAWFALGAFPALAAVPADEAAKLKSTLTPVGAERAGNADGSIPAWEGGLTKPTPGFVNGGRRPDPFAGEKPQFSITGKNMDAYADKLTEGTRVLLKKYPDYRLDVYKTQRTFAAPQFIYDRTAKNAVTTKMVEGTSGGVPSGFAGGYPFPIPKTGEEAMMNHWMRWSTSGYQAHYRIYLTTAQGKQVLQAENAFTLMFPYNQPTPNTKDNGVFMFSRFANLGPPLAKGGGAVAAFNFDPDQQTVHVYLTGQRRVKMVPNACCDTPAPGTGGTLNFDEINVFDGTLKQFNWKIVGKREMYIPYNSNRALVPTDDAAVMMPRFVNPDVVRWELHRVWILEAELKPGRRHINPKSRYYLDEDSWTAVLGERWDAQGQLVKAMFSVPLVLPDAPAIYGGMTGGYDLLTGQWFVSDVQNFSSNQIELKTDFPANYFTPDSLAGEGVR